VALNLPGPTGAAAIASRSDLRAPGQGEARHDALIAGKLAEVLSGRRHRHDAGASEDQLLALERKAFQALIRTDKTLARIEHTLETGRPLRN